MDKNPFKNINNDIEVPKEMKASVMNNVAKAKLIKDLSNLFTDNYKSSLKNLFKDKNSIE